MTMDLTSSASCLLNVALYLTLEKARENVMFLNMFTFVLDYLRNDLVNQVTAHVVDSQWG